MSSPRRDRKAYKRKWRLLQYGITLEDYEEIFQAQCGLCGICGRSPRAGELLCVDHCHDTDVIRGLLCRMCNASLGGLGDTVESLEKAIAYLRRSDVAPV